MSPESINKTQIAKLEKDKNRVSLTGCPWGLSTYYPRGMHAFTKDSISQKTSYGGKKTIEWREDMGASKDMVLPFPNGHPLPKRSRIM